MIDDILLTVSLCLKRKGLSHDLVRHFIDHYLPPVVVCHNGPYYRGSPWPFFTVLDPVVAQRFIHYAITVDAEYRDGYYDLTGIHLPPEMEYPDLFEDGLYHYCIQGYDLDGPCWTYKNGILQWVIYVTDYPFYTIPQKYKRG